MNTHSDEIYRSITKKQIFIVMGIGGALGFLLFCALYGVSFLDVTNDDWLLSGGDLMQHYVGWKAYRASDWHFPLGMTDGLLYPGQTCVVFTDSIPLFAIFFKLLSPILPETFQYFGLWGAMTYFLMGGLSAVILRRYTKELWVCIIGSVFFSFSPYIIQRLYAHTALAGNWVILLAILIWVYKPYFNSFKRKTIAWTGVLVLGSLIHIYYIPMVMIFMIFSCFQDLLENEGWKMDFLMGFIAVVVDLTVLFCVGAFSATSSMEDVGLGVYSANLNTFFNHLGRGRFLNRFPFNPGQDEGYGYLGLGILILLVIAAVLLLIRCVQSLRKKGSKAKVHQSVRCILKKYAFIISMICAWLAAFILAISPTITYNNKTLLTISYPDKIMKLLSIFRGSGRFIWCCCYVLMFFSMIVVIKYVNQKIVLAACLLVTAAVQVADLQSFAFAKGELIQNQRRDNVLVSQEWEQLAEGKAHLTYLPFSVIKTSYDDDAVYEFANFAIDHGLTVNYYTAARVDIKALENQDWQVHQLLAGGNKSTDTLYILGDANLGRSYGMTVETVDNIVVGYFE